MKTKTIFTILALFVPLFLSAQERKTPEQEEKEYYESIQKEVDKYASSLVLEDWQIFYADSILVHNYTAMRKELMDLNEAKVSNSDIYFAVQDKWMEASYAAFNKILDESQWKKYLKQGAARDKRERDKRAAKAVKADKENKKEKGR